MRVIIAGGRDVQPSDETMDRVMAQLNLTVTEVVSGKCSGVDTAGEGWAKRHNIPIKEFPADWKKYGKPAGPIRNAAMADYADALVVFPGGAGTANMSGQMSTLGKLVYKVTDDKK